MANSFWFFSAQPCRLGALCLHSAGLPEGKNEQGLASLLACFVISWNSRRISINQLQAQAAICLLASSPIASVLVIKTLPATAAVVCTTRRPISCFNSASMRSWSACAASRALEIICSAWEMAFASILDLVGCGSRLFDQFVGLRIGLLHDFLASGLGSFFPA